MLGSGLGLRIVLGCKVGKNFLCVPLVPMERRAHLAPMDSRGWHVWQLIVGRRKAQPRVLPLSPSALQAAYRAWAAWRASFLETKVDRRLGGFDLVGLHKILMNGDIHARNQKKRRRTLCWAGRPLDARTDTACSLLTQLSNPRTALFQPI